MFPVIWNGLNAYLNRKRYKSNMSLKLRKSVCVYAYHTACIWYIIDDREERCLTNFMSSSSFSCYVMLLNYLEFHKQTLTLHIILPLYLASKFLPISYPFFENQFYTESFSHHSFWSLRGVELNIPYYKHSLFSPLIITFTYFQKACIYCFITIYVCPYP